LKLLVVKLHALGDLTIATPAIRRLRDGLPEARIDLLTTSWSAPAVVANPCIDRLIVIRDEIFFSPGLRTLPPTAKLLLELRRERYDAALIFHRRRAVELFIKAAGIPDRYRFNGGEDGKSVLLDEGRHSALTAWELADLMVRKLGGEEVQPPGLEGLRYEWFVQPDEAQRARDLLVQSGVGERPFAVFLPGGGVNPRVNSRVKRWGTSGFAALAEWLRNEAGFQILLLGGSSDRSACAEVADEAMVEVIDLSGGLDIRLSAAVMALSGLVVSGDSGPLHIAAAVGVPVVGIFGPTGVRHKLPPGDRVYAASLGLPCSPCFFGAFSGCIFDRIRCLEELPVETVEDAVRKALEHTTSVGVDGS